MTDTEQEPFGAMTAVEQAAMELENSEELFPATVTVEMWRVAPPELVTVMLMGFPLVVPCVMVGKLAGFGEMVTAGTGAGVASPEMLMTWGESGASSESEMVSVRWPGAAGAKVREMVQVVFGAMALLEQLLAGLEKSAGLFPAMATVVM